MSTLIVLGMRRGDYHFQIRRGRDWQVIKVAKPKNKYCGSCEYLMLRMIIWTHATVV